jgi:hypothetical protein
MGEFKETLRTVGVAMIAASKNFTPADKKLYALRDVTATVPSVTLQVQCLAWLAALSGGHGHDELVANSAARSGL